MLATVQTKRVLIIGLGTQEDAELRKINGDKNVLLLKNILIEAGYNSISTLVNEQMTKSRITVSFSSI